MQSRRGPGTQCCGLQRGSWPLGPPPGRRLELPAPPAPLSRSLPPCRPRAGQALCWTHSALAALRSRTLPLSQQGNRTSALQALQVHLLQHHQSLTVPGTPPPQVVLTQLLQTVLSPEWAWCSADFPVTLTAALRGKR